MNLILFTPEETAQPLPRRDPRAQHLLEVLRRQPGESFDVGLIDGPRGKACIESSDTEALHLRFTWGAPPPPLPDLELWIGLPRPQTARKILQEATTAGVRALHFFPAERGEPSYGQSHLWSSGEWRRHCVAGAEQAFCTRLPEVTWHHPLAELLATAGSARGLALDNYEATSPLATQVRPGPLRLALGPERGWSPAERDRLRSHGWPLVHLGARVLRSETAVTFALGVVQGALGSR